MVRLLDKKRNTNPRKVHKDKAKVDEHVLEVADPSNNLHALFVKKPQ